jgi:hypothetical protein
MADSPERQGLIVDIGEVYKMRDRRAQELEFYRGERAKIEARMAMVARDLEVTDTIIRMLENDKIQDLTKVGK